ncbi:hypothetical protein C8F01DRAFT_1087034 [Mycena amicta]|nr:hypothetical protein C8F01DRAFT_1087034 [Mycena amicta]
MDSDAAPMNTQTDNHQPDAAPMNPQTDNHQPDAAPMNPQTDNHQPHAAPTNPQTDNHQPDAAPMNPQSNNHQPDAAPMNTQTDNHQPDAAPMNPQSNNHRPDAAPMNTQTDNHQPDAAPMNTLSNNYQWHTNSVLPVVFYLQLPLSDIQLQTTIGNEHPGDLVPLLNNKFTPWSPCRILITGACAAFSVTRIILRPPFNAPVQSQRAFRSIAYNLAQAMRQIESSQQAPEPELRWVYVEEGEEDSPLVYIEFNTAARGIVTSREYNFVHWLPGHNRSPARLIEEGAILRCWVDLRARRETTEDGTTRISAWILDGTSVTRCYRSIRHDAVRRRVQLRRVPDMIDLTQVGDDTGIRAASESRTGVRDIIDLTQVADAGVSAASGTRTDVEMIDLSIDD